MKKILIDTVFIVGAFLLLVLGLLTCNALGQEPPRVRVIDGVEYRLFTADELKPILAKLNEREDLIEENKLLDQTLRETFEKLDELRENHKKELRLAKAKCEGEVNFWKSQYESERSNLLRLEALYKSCSARILGLFRICRL